MTVTADKLIQVFKVEYDPQGKPVPVPVAVRSTGKGRLYITENRTNGPCKDVDYVQLGDGLDGRLVLYSAVFSTTAEEAMAHWLDQSKRRIAEARITVEVLERAFAALGLDTAGRPPAPEPAAPRKLPKRAPKAKAGTAVAGKGRKAKV